MVWLLVSFTQHHYVTCITCAPHQSVIQSKESFVLAADIGCGTVYRGWRGTVYQGWFQPRYTQNQKTQNSRASDWSSQSVPRLKLSVVHCTAWAVVHWTAWALVHCTALAMVHCTMSAAVQCIKVEFSWFQPRYTVPQLMQYTLPPPKQKIPMTDYCAQCQCNHATLTSLL